MFGSSKPAFGSTANTFGATGSSLFGQQNKPAGSLFGQTSSANTSGSSLFGQKTTTNVFGSPSTPQQSTSIFGAQPAANTSGGSLFGQSKPSLFGASSTPQQTNTFGASSSGGGLFGSSTTTTSGGLFGGSAAAVPNGTTVKFNPLVAQDTMMKNGSQQTIQTKNFCITAMKEYESKSFEELRVEDYMANRKAPAAGSTTSGGLFGSSTTASTGTSLFGATQQQQQKPSLFGSPAASSSPFGGTASTGGTSLFGGQTSTPQQGTSLFGQKPASGGLFGQAAQPAATTFGASTGTTNLFGASTSTPAFGAAQPQQQQSSLFGGSTFGQPAQQQQSGGLFGAPAASTFGQAAAPATGGLFGGSTPAAGGTSLFGKPATTQSSGFGFGGAATNTSFGAATTNTGGGLFGNTAAKPGGLFGAPAASTGSLFGSQPAQSGGLFGAQPAQQQAGGLFGAAAPAASAATIPSTVSMPAPVVVLGSDVNETHLKMAMIEARLAASPYGDSPLLSLLSSSKNDTDDKPNPTSTTRQMRFLAAKSANNSTVMNSPSSAACGNLSVSSNTLKTSFLSSETPVAGSKIRSAAIPPGQDLNYTSSGRTPRIMNGTQGRKPANLPDFVNKSILDKSSGIDHVLERALAGNGNVLSARKSNIKHLDVSVLSDLSASMNRSAAARDPDELPRTKTTGTDQPALSEFSPTMAPREAAIQRVQERDIVPPPRLNFDATMSEDSSMASPAVAQRSGASRSSPVVEMEDRPAVTAPAGVRLNSTDYYCEPTIREMANMIVDGKVVLPDGLTVGRATYGNVFWPGRIELSDVVLDEIVVFRHKEVTVYPDESKKPEEGEGLNREAEVTLERVWHLDKQTKQEVKDPLLLADMGWRDRLERVAANMGAVFKDYRPTTGSWVFKVEHFSKYGLPDDEGDSALAAPAATVPPSRTGSALSERQLQSKVQRTGLHLLPPTSNDEMIVEDYEDAENSPAYSTETLKRNVGLGGNSTGGLLGIVDDDYLMNDTMNNMEDEERSYDELPPEKKAKMEYMDQLHEESKMLMDLLLPSSRTFVCSAPAAVEPTRQFTGGVKRSESTAKGTSSLIDLASARGAVSRVGWSATGRFVMSLQPSSNQVYVKSLDWSNDLSEDLISDMLENNMRLSQTIRRNNSISAQVRHCEVVGQTVAPRIKPDSDHAQLIDSFMATAQQSSRLLEERVWKLCRAIFPESREGRWRVIRTEKVCDWLREEVARENLSSTNDKGKGVAVWSALCRGQLLEAIDAAIDENLHHLASLLAVFQVDPRATQQQFDQQISFWESSSSLGLIEVSVLKVYLAMSGRCTVDRTRNGRKERVSCIEGLNWKQAMGVYLWWLRGFSSLEECLDKAFNAVPSPKEADDSLFFEILRLARDPTHKLESVLDAAALLGANGLDNHLSWHLWSVLRSVGYNSMSADSEQRLHRAYAEQLIAASLPHLAVFVLSHISSDQCRSDAIHGCLERVAPDAKLTDYQKMSECCDLPKAWIAAANYITAKASGDSTRACSLALEAGDIITAHCLFVKEVAPQAVVAEDLETLSEMIDKFAAVSDRIPAWGQNGQLYADYVELKSLTPDEDDEKLSQLVNTIQTRLQAPVFHSPIQRLCAESISLLVYQAQILLRNRPSVLPIRQGTLQRLIRKV